MPIIMNNREVIKYSRRNGLWNVCGCIICVSKNITCKADSA